MLADMSMFYKKWHFLASIVQDDYGKVSLLFEIQREGSLLLEVKKHWPRDKRYSPVIARLFFRTCLIEAADMVSLTPSVFSSRAKIRRRYALPIVREVSHV